MNVLQKNKKVRTSVYVINDDFRIVYYNDELKCIDPELTCGHYCYEVLYGEHSQCKRCPIREKNGRKSIVFDKTHNEWVSVTAVPIEMPGVGKCNVITSEGIENNNNSSFLKEADNWFYNKKCFFTVVEEVLKNNASAGWCMLSIDIENFKLFNEWYGRKLGDTLLTGICECLKKQQEEMFCMAGYFGNDDFAMLMPYDEKQIEDLYRAISTLLDSYSNKTKFLPLFGIYEITDETESVCTMYDRADLARASVKGNYTARIKKFDMGMLEELEAQYFLYSDIQNALKAKEFTFFLQPKCNMENGKIIGAEALVRWESAEKGIVSPGVFIPFLERTGLITELDLFIWEEVCKWQRSLIERGIQPTPVSVNVSRMDLYYMGVPAYFRELIGKYNLNPELIEIEITESIYAEDDEFISEAIADLRKSGFHVLMDDFGSGYSSLNMLKDIEIDVLKMDMRFLDINKENANKGINIMESILNMASLLGIKVIAEGVEVEAQKEFLLRMGSGYGQGYYFYRPMPKEEFEALISDPDNLDSAGFQNKRIEQLYLKDLLSEDMFSEVMINNMLGALVFYDVYEEQITIKRYNEHYAELFSDITFESGMRIDFRKYFCEEECQKIFGIFECAKENRHEGAEGDIYRRRMDGSEMWLHLRMFFLKEQDGHAIYYSSVRDVTDIYMKNEELRFLSSDMPCGVFQYEADGNREFSYVSSGMLDMLGYTREAFDEKFKNTFDNLVYEEDRQRIEESIYEQIEHSNYDSCEYRIETADGSLKWVYDHARLDVDNNGKRWFYVVIMDYDYLEKKYREKEWQMMKYKTLAEIPGTIVYDYEPDMDKLTLEITEEDGNTKTIVAEKFLENMEHHPWLADEGIRQQKKDIRSVMSGPMTKISEFKGRFTEDSEFKWYRSHFRSLADEDGKVYRIVGRAECEENKA